MVGAGAGGGRRHVRGAVPRASKLCHASVPNQARSAGSGVGGPILGSNEPRITCTARHFSTPRRASVPARMWGMRDVSRPRSRGSVTRYACRGAGDRPDREAARTTSSPASSFAAPDLSRGAIAHRVKAGRCSGFTRTSICSVRRHRRRWRALGRRLSPAGRTRWSAIAQPPVFTAFCQRPAAMSTSRSPGAAPGDDRDQAATASRSSRSAGRPTVMRGLRITTIARTICDLAATESARATEQAFQEALYRRIVTTRAIEAVIAREPTRRGSRHHPGAARRPPPHPLREGTQDPQADRPGPAPEAPHERPRPRLPGRRLLALTRSRPRVRRLGRPRPPAGVREQPQA